MGQAGHLARTGKKRNAYRVSVRRPGKKETIRKIKT
jgi:hypothetical protein